MSGGVGWSSSNNVGGGVSWSGQNWSSGDYGLLLNDGFVHMDWWVLLNDVLLGVYVVWSWHIFDSFNWVCAWYLNLVWSWDMLDHIVWFCDWDLDFVWLWYLELNGKKIESINDIRISIMLLDIILRTTALCREPPNDHFKIESIAGKHLVREF